MCLVLWAWANVTSLFPSCSVSPVRLNPSCTVTAILSQRVRSWVKCEPVFPGSVAESKKEKRKKKIEKRKKKNYPSTGTVQSQAWEPQIAVGSTITWSRHWQKMSSYLLKRCLRETLGLTFMNSITLWAEAKKNKRKDEAEKATAQLVPCQWRELVEETLKSSPQNQNKTPLFCSLK